MGTDPLLRGNFLFLVLEVGNLAYLWQIIEFEKIEFFALQGKLNMKKKLVS